MQAIILEQRRLLFGLRLRLPGKGSVRNPRKDGKKFIIPFPLPDPDCQNHGSVGRKPLELLAAIPQSHETGLQSNVGIVERVQEIHRQDGLPFCGQMPQ